MKTPRTNVLQITFLVLFLVAVGQVTWWILDQVTFTEQVQRDTIARYEEDVDAANALLAQGMPAARVRELLPKVVVEGGAARLDSALVADAMNQRRRRLNRYGWEGTFFLVVLIAGMAILARAIVQERTLRQRQRNFVAAVSHEFKSPLASLQLAAETLSIRDLQREDRQRLIERMLRDLSRLQTMVTNILDTSRLEQGRIALTREPVQLAREAAATVEEVQRDLPAPDVEISCDIPETVEIDADPIAVRTVLRNLLDNAVKATAAAGGGRVSVSAIEQNGYANVMVSDTGIGFPSDDANKIFEKFYRPGNEMRRETRGTGLGLYIVKNLVELGGGCVWAQSDGPGQGASVMVSWPTKREKT